MSQVCGIYKITNPKGRIYIGQSVDVNSRISSYRNARCKSQPRLLHSLKKYGWEKHSFEIIHRCNPDELNGLEKYYVDLYRCFNTKHGLNLRDGGGSKGRISDESKRKIADWQKINSPFKGRKHSEQSLIKMRGRKNSPETIRKMKENKIITPESRETMSVSQRLRMKLQGVSIETRAKQRSNSLGEKNPNAKIVLNTETGIYYFTMEEASYSIGKAKSYLYYIFTKKKKTKFKIV